MKNIYFVQVGFEFDGSVYLPYAVGTIIAYCQNDPKIKNKYAFPNIIFKREKLSFAMEKIVDPYIVAFSCSVWNMEYNKALAKKIKEKFPDCLVVFGGHSVNEDASLLKEEKNVDILMFGEGEKTFSSLLSDLSSSSLEKTENIAFRKGDEIIRTERSYCESLEDLPSPYLSGVFEKIIEENKGIEFLSVLETNRGCPYSCAYCDWCAGKKMRFFPMEKIMAEIKWLSENKITYCFCADSNFGMFERDLSIAEALISAKRKNGYPEVFRPCYEKNSDERVFKICSALNSEGMDKGATMAYQTLSDEALFNIGRKNLTMEHFSSLMKKYNEAGIPTYSELILGLPGETKESFCKGICRLLENGQHNSLSVYHCEALPNSDLTRPEYIKKHQIEIIKVAFNHIHSAPKKDEEVKEFSYLVRSTATLSREDWVYSNLFSVCVQCFHSLGILRFFAIYLYFEKNVSYFDFYSSLLRYIFESEGRLNKLWQDFKEKYESSLAGDWNYYNESFGNVTWFFEEGAFIEIVSDYPSFMKELFPFLEKFNIEKELLTELYLYQELLIRKPFEREKKAAFSYDFHSFFENATKGKPSALKKKELVLNVVPKKEYKLLSEYSKETVWFGRRRGATIYSGNEIIFD
ncbi:MAG: cobalamin-dependent protein [Clostridia bacterium]|nr:cobalamin-dependent protein [Clostridia bacterium]